MYKIELLFVNFPLFVWKNCLQQLTACCFLNLVQLVLKKYSFGSLMVQLKKFRFSSLVYSAFDVCFFVVGFVIAMLPPICHICKNSIKFIFCTKNSVGYTHFTALWPKFLISNNLGRKCEFHQIRCSLDTA